MTRVPGAKLLFRGGVPNTVLKGDAGTLTPAPEVRRDPRPFTLLDCFDQSLRKSGHLLIASENRLLLVCPDGSETFQNASSESRFIHDIPAGPVRDRLIGIVPSLRCLLPVCIGQMAEWQLARRDGKGRQALVMLRELQTREGRICIATTADNGGRPEAAKLIGRIRRSFGEPLSMSSAYLELASGHADYDPKPDIPMSGKETVFDLAGEIIGTYLDVARRNEAGIIADHDTEFLHDYRVALRRVRSVVGLFKGVYSEGETSSLKAAFSDLMAPTGAMRDLDVFLLDRRAFFDLLPESQHEGLSHLCHLFETDRAAQHAVVSARLLSDQYQQEIGAMQRRFFAPVSIEAGPKADKRTLAYARRLIWKRYHQLWEVTACIRPDTPDHEIHELRIRCKKLRYLMEIFAPLYSRKKFKLLLRPLKRLQDNLGRFNDHSVHQIMIREALSANRHGRPIEDMELVGAAGGLIAVLHQRQNTERALVMDNLSRFRDPEIRTLFRDLTAR